MFLRFDKKSIFIRLTILYSILAFLLIFIASILLYSVLVDNIKWNDDNFMLGKVRTLENILHIQTKKNKLVVLRQEVMHEPKTSEHHYFIRIKFNNDRILMETPGFKRVSFNERKAKTPYISISRVINIQNNTYEIQITLNVASSKKLIKRYKLNLYIALFLNLFISMFFGYTITSAGMRPLKKISHDLMGIDADELGVRLDIRNLPKELEEITKSINNLLVHVEKAFQRLSQFSSDLAHELHTPLNNLICQSEIILNKSREKEEYKKILVSNLDECKKLASLINQILFIARAKNPNKHVHKVHAKFSLIMKPILDYFKLLANEKSITLLMVGDEILYIDITLFKRAIANLLVNSIKYTPCAGVITINVGKNNKNDVIISIIDEGIGISAKDIPYLFDRFYRVNDSRSRVEGGTGLGLAIVKSIMSLHGGSVTVSSQLGKGSIFELYFPSS